MPPCRPGRYGSALHLSSQLRPSAPAVPDGHLETLARPLREMLRLHGLRHHTAAEHAAQLQGTIAKLNARKARLVEGRLVAPEGLKPNPLVGWLVRLATLEGALAPAC